MKKVLYVFAAVLVLFVYSVDVHGEMVTLKCVSSGVYEGGKFTPGEDKYEARYIIDEDAGVVKEEKVMQSDREGRIAQDSSYEITNTLMSEGLSGLMVDLKRKGQKIITAVRDEDVGSTEIIIIGEDFYEYCRAANGKLYLESGEVASVD